MVLGRVTLLLLLLAQSALAGKPIQNVFWSRPCAGLISAVLETLPRIGEFRMPLESVRQTASVTLARWAEEELPSEQDVYSDKAFALGSEDVHLFNRDWVAYRLNAVRAKVENLDTLVAVIDGTHAIEAFLERFEDKTEAFVEACQKPSAFRERELLSHVGKALVLASTVVAGSNLAADPSHSWLWMASALSAVMGLRMDCGFSFRLNALRDGTTPASAQLPQTLTSFRKVAQADPEVGNWFYWATQQRFSYETLMEMWDQTWGDWIPGPLIQSMNMDDEVNLMSSFQNWLSQALLRRQQKHGVDISDAARTQAYGPSVYFDVIVFKAGFAGLRSPRLIATIRMPPGINKPNGGNDHGGGKKRKPSPRPSPNGRTLQPVM